MFLGLFFIFVLEGKYTNENKVEWGSTLIETQCSFDWSFLFYCQSWVCLSKTQLKYNFIRASATPSEL